MLFEKKTDYLFPKETNAFGYGSTGTFEISRELPIENIYLRMTANWSTVTTPTYTADGILNLPRRLVLNGPDGARNRNVIDVSAAGLIELSKHWTGYIDPNTAAFINSNRSAGTYSPTVSAAADNTFVVPVHFGMPNIEDPLGSAFLLPVDRYNANPLLQVQFGASSDLISAGTLTLGTVTNGSVAGAAMSLVVNRRIINRLNWPIVDAEIGELRQDYAATGANQAFQLPITGYYTALLLRAFRTAAIKGDPSYATLAQYVLANANNPWTLELSGNVIRRFRLCDIEFENDLSESTGGGQGDILSGSYLLDFLQDKVGGDTGDPGVALGSLLNANIPLNSGAQLALKQNIQVANTSMRYLYHRFYANLKDLQFK
jgi:hypothetical protein